MAGRVPPDCLDRAPALRADKLVTCYLFAFRQSYRARAEQQVVS
ncbi:hypothetical protein [Streptomyces sp. NPDC048266]